MTNIELFNLNAQGEVDSIRFNECTHLNRLYVLNHC